MTTSDQPPTEKELDRTRELLRTYFGWSNYEIEKALRKQENDRQERVRRSLGSHGPWGGER